MDISTHTPHARRDYQQKYAGCMFGISTHTPHARRDMKEQIEQLIKEYISTHTPHARRDEYGYATDEALQISTHTPHARRDFSVPSSVHADVNFNSHASCEA